METIYFIGIPIATIAVSALDPLSCEIDYVKRGGFAFLIACFWPAVLLVIAAIALCGYVGQGGARLIEWLLNRWPEVFK